MLARSLTAYFSGTLLLLAGMAGSVVAKPPDLPVKVEVNCGPGPSKLVPRVYPVGDLVIPLGNHPSSASIILSNAEGAIPPPKLAPPMPLSPEQIGAPHSAGPGQELRLEAVPGTQLQRYTTSTCDSPCEPPSSPPASEKTQEEQLIKLIMNMIEPASWSQRGGQATLEYFPLGMALVVNQTPEIQEQIAELLSALRRLQDAEVAFEVRFVTVSDSVYERLGCDFNFNNCNNQSRFEPQLVVEQFRPFSLVKHFVRVPTKETACPHDPADHKPAPACPGNSPCVTFLNDREVFQFMEAVQGDPRTNVMQAPKMTVFNGQTSKIAVTDQQLFVTSVKTLKESGHSVFVPQQEFVTT